MIYCAGLGAVSPNIATGAAAGASPVSTTTNEVVLTIGSQTAATLFAGLAPGFVGLYQVNAIVPDGVAEGNSVPVTLTVAGQASAPVAMAVQSLR